MGAEVCGFEGIREFYEVMNQRFAACDDDEVWVCGFSLIGELVDRNLRVMFIAPGDFGIAPRAANIAEGKANKVGIGSAPSAFALDGMKGFNDR